MKDRYHPETEREALSTDVAERLLARAAELDSAQRNSAEIARLREASAEAGMLPSAFDAALAELREGQRQPAGATGRGRRRIQAFLLAALVSMVAVVTVKRVVPSPAPGVEQSFLLQCIATRDAAALLVHSIGDPAMELKIPPEPTSHVLTVRTATTKQMEEVRAAFDQMNRMCVAPAAARPVR